jgi:predicted CXXCH cytochrome family protein
MIGLVAFVLLAQDRFAADTDATCLTCHEKQKEDWKDSIHAVRQIGCVACHGTDEINPKASMPHLRTLAFQRGHESPPFCGRCHAGELEEFKRSPHYEDWEGGGKVKGCLSCHAAHKTAPANRHALLNGRDPGCLQCHKPESRQVAAMKKFAELADGLQGELVKLEECFREKTPGLSWMTESVSREAHVDGLRKFRTRQHATEFITLAEEVPAATARVRAELRKAEEKKRRFATSKILGLAGFLVVMALNPALARRWCRRAYP